MKVVDGSVMARPSSHLLPPNHDGEREVRRADFALKGITVTGDSSGTEWRLLGSSPPLQLSGRQERGGREELQSWKSQKLKWVQKVGPAIWPRCPSEGHLPSLLFLSISYRVRTPSQAGSGSQDIGK